MLNTPNSSQNGIVYENGQEIHPEPALMFLPVASFWRRLFAWFLDYILVGIIGLVINAIVSSFPFGLGRYGYLAGVLFMTAYFGIMNSKVGGGQTIGKRVLKIAVRGKNNAPIEPVRSLIRSAVLAVPVLFDEWPLLMLQNSVTAWFLSVLIFGLGGAILYTMIFNWETRQGVHDLVVGTYVVHLAGNPTKSLPITSRKHYTIAGLWVGFVAIASLALILVGPSLLDLLLTNMSPRTLPYDCLSLRDDDSIVLFSNVTYTAYRSHDGGITWSKDPAIDREAALPCSSNWPVTVKTEPPIDFYYMEDLGIYQSLDDGETLTSVPVVLHQENVPQSIATSFDTLVVSIGGGEAWLRLPDGEWVHYKEKPRKLLLEPAAE